MTAQDEALEAQIGQWRSWLRRRPAIRPSDVEELEGHLRDQVAALAAAGLAADEAFLVAVKRMGNLDAVSREFAREHSERLWKQLVAAPAGAGETGRWVAGETLVVVALAAAAALAVKLPEVFGYPPLVDVDEELLPFYFRNMSFFVLPFLAAYFRLEAAAGPDGVRAPGAGVRRRRPRHQRPSVHARRPHADARGAAPADRAVAGGGRRLRRGALARRRRAHGLRALLGRAVHLLRAHGAGRRRAHRVHPGHLRRHRPRRGTVRAAVAAAVRRDGRDNRRGLAGGSQAERHREHGAQC